MGLESANWELGMEKEIEKWMDPGANGTLGMEQGTEKWMDPGASGALGIEQGICAMDGSCLCTLG